MQRICGVVKFVMCCVVFRSGALRVLCDAVWCVVVFLWCSVVKLLMVICDVLWCAARQNAAVCCLPVWCDVVWCGVMLCGVV